MVLYTLILQFLFKKWAKEKKEDDTFLRKKNGGKTKWATIMISIDSKGTVFPVKLKLQG